MNDKNVCKIKRLKEYERDGTETQTHINTIHAEPSHLGIGMVLLCNCLDLKDLGSNPTESILIFYVA